VGEINEVVPGAGVLNLQLGPVLGVVKVHPTLGEIGDDTIEVDSKSEALHRSSLPFPIPIHQLDRRLNIHERGFVSNRLNVQMV
jgi:hypothetical protein